MVQLCRRSTSDNSPTGALRVGLIQALGLWVENMEAGTRVKLQSFNGTQRAAASTKSSENYWLLVGSAGTVHNFSSELGRYLVEFDISVDSLGLHCHNAQPNSLYISPSDLVALEPGPEA